MSEFIDGQTTGFWFKWSAVRFARRAERAGWTVKVWYQADWFSSARWSVKVWREK